MNKVFRVIWSQATQSWVAVSELTKAHKKQSSSSAKKSVSGSSANLIKSSAIALSLLSGSAAYAAETAANGLIQINSKGMATATSSDSIAIGKDSKATGNDGIALGNQAKAENKNTVAIGRESKASGESGIALGYQATADKQFTVAIGAGASSKHNNAVAIGKGSQALGATSLALVMGSKATGNDSYAIGWSSDSIGEMSMAFGRESKARKKYDIVFGAEANTRDQGQGHSIAIGVGAMSGTNSAGKNYNGGDAGGVAIGTGAYTGVNKNNISLNSSVAVGAGAGAGYREVDADGLPTKVATDADNNNKVLVKAFGGTTSTLDYFKNAGNADKEGFFSFQGVNINEATALGRNARAIGDQSVAIGAQSVAGQGSIVIGGNDIQAYDNKKYFKALNPDSKDAKGVNDFDAETTPGTGKNGNPITIRDKYKELVGTVLDNSYRSSYGQDGSTVIGMQAHSTTPLGVAIGTNSIVRKGAFGATAIGSGASVLANAEAAVAIGMGSEAQGNYAVAAGTGAKAEESAVAAGYQANAGKSAVAVGDSSKAATSSVAVGQGAVSEQVSDIAIGQGAKAKGEQGAIAMGLGTIAQGHSSIMIGGSDISTAANQVVEYSREKVTKDGTPELYDGKITEVINGKTVTRTIKLVKTETVAGEKLSDAYREITGYRLSTDSLDYSSSDNKNGHASISMGIHSLSKGAMGVAIGTGARADALGSMALGTGAHAGMQNSVAIGTGAVADEVSKGTRQTDISYDEDGNVVETGSAKAKYTFRWAGGINTSEGDVVSFGTPGAERQLKNVAAGRVAEDSTDAVNGSQLNAITRSLSQTITNGWQVGGNNKFRVSNIGSNGRVNFLDGLGTAVNIAEINQAEDTKGNKLVKIGSDFYKASDFTDGKLNAGAQKVAAAEIKKQPAGANVTFDVKEVNSTLSVNSVGLKVTTGEVTANSDGTMKTPNNTTKADNATVTKAMNDAETALVASQKEWRKKNDAYQQTESAYLAAETALTKGKEAVEAIQADIATTQQELQAAQSTLATDQAALARAQADVDSAPTDTKKQSVLHKANEKVESTQFVVDQRTQKLAHQKETLKERQSQVTVLEQEKTNAETARNTAKDAYDVANSDLNKKKEDFDTAKKAFVAAGANQIATVQNVADSINASGWTLQQGTSDKDLVQPGDKVAFVDGDGTTVSVETADNKKTSTIKYSVNLGDGLEKTDDNKIKAKAGDGVTVGSDGIKVNTGKGLKIDAADGNKVAVDTDGTTITVDNKGKVKAVTGSTEAVTDANKGAGEKAGQVRPVEADKGKLATVDTVAQAVNSAKWMAKATNTDVEVADTDKTNDTTTGTDIAAGDEVTFTAGKNLRVKREGKNFTFATDKDVSFDSVKVGAEDTAANGKKTVSLTTQAATTADNNQTAPTTALNISSGTGTDAKPTQITGVGSVLKTTTVTSAPDGTAPANQPKLVNLGTAHNQTALADNVLNSAATVRDLANMGWKVSSDETTGAKGAYLDVVKNADEVKFVGKNAAKVSGKTENGVRTITVDVEVHDVKTAKLVSSTDGSVIAPSTDSKLQDALKAAKDELAALPNTATKAEKEAAENKVKDAETALNKALDDKGVATAKNVADMINNSGFTLKTSATDDGKKDDKSTGSEVIKPGKTVEMVAGKNLTVKQEADGKVTYSLNPVLTGLTSAEFKGTAANAPTTTLNNSGITITTPADAVANTPKKTVTLNQDGLNNGGNAITNVAGNLDGAKANTQVPTTNAAAPNTTNKDGDKYINPNNAATVGDVLNAGWNLQNNGAAKDFVKPYDIVNFRDGGNTTVTVTTDDNLTSHVQVNVTGLPVSNTITDPATGKQVPVVKVGDAFYRTNPDGTPNIERNDEGEPTNGYVRANDGKLYPRDAVEVTPNAADPTQPPTITPKADAKPTTVNTNLVNPNVDNTTDNPGNNVNTPNQLGNVANGAKTFNAVDADGKDYVKANNGKYYEPSKVNADGSLKDGTDATADAKNPLVLANDGKWYPADKVSDKGTPEAGATAVENPLAPKNAAGQPLVRAKDGKWYTPADVQPNGLPTPTAQPQDNAINNKAGLVDFANSNPNNAATIGDLQNMGWVVSAPGNSYSDQVRNANEVQFVGEGTAIVTGKTDDKGVRTITVKVDNQVSTNNSVTPVVYTDKNGNTVYPIKDDKGNVAYHTTPDGKGKGDTVVPNGDVNTSVNGPKDEQGNTRPASLGNVKNNIPAVNDVDKKVTNPDGTEKGTAGDVNNINKAPLTATEAADLLNPRKDGKPNPNFVGNNAATVSDVLNAGWNLQNNGTAKDFVKPYDTVNFINGLGTTAVVTTREGNTTSDVTFNVKAANGSVTVDEDGVKVTTGEMKPAVDANNKETGAIATSANPATAKQLKDALDAAVKELATAKDALKTAEKALEANPKDPALQQAVADKKAEVAAKQTPVDAAQKAHDEAGLNKVATVQNVAEAINNAGFNLTTSAATGGEKLKGAKNDGELIKPSNTVEMVAGKNLTVKQDDKGKITYATKDDVTFTNVNTGTLNVGSPNTYTDGKGNTYTKVGDNYYNPADVENGAPKPDATPVTIPADVVVKPVSPVTMKTEAAKLVMNNATDAQPSSALNITSKDGKPTQITGVGSTLNTNVVKTSPEGTPTTPGAAPKTEDAHLVDLKGIDADPVNKNAAATVGDLQNMGWVVSTKDGNGYTDVVKNANKVDFKGGAGISVKGETTKDGVREITISVKDGEVVKPNQFTAKVNGTDTPVTKVGDQYYNTADIDPKTGNPKDNVTPVTPDKGTTPTNAGDGYVTGNKVAAAIQKSGFIVGKQTEKLSAADFNDKDEKVNPDDELRFADGNNTKVKLATKVSVDKDGNKVTTTTVKVDVTGLPVQYTDKNGTRVTKVGNQYFTVDDKGNPTATEVKPEYLTTNMVNPAAAPNVIGAPTTLGNVEGNLDGAKTGTTAPTDSHAAPNTADATKPNYVNTHNAATVGDVLNAGWNLQNNGKAKDFVKPYDTVNFVDGKGTKAVVETADNLTSTVKFDVDAGKITADTTKPGAVKGPADETLTKALKDAKDALAKLPKDADAATVKAAQDKVDAAQKAIDDSPNSNKVATAQNVADMINNSGFTLKADKTKGDNSTAADLANGEMIHPGDTITMKAGKNMSVKHEKNGSITYETKDDVNFNSLSLGDSKHAPTLSADEDGSLRLGSKNNQAPVRISNVAPGIKDGDAVNVSQLKGVTKDLEDKIDGVAAGSNAAASLPQVYLPGKSMVAASVGTYGSQGALAVGYSSISDNGKWLIKGQINVNTKAKTGGGVGYLW